MKYSPLPPTPATMLRMSTEFSRSPSPSATDRSKAISINISPCTYRTKLSTSFLQALSTQFPPCTYLTKGGIIREP